MKLFRLVCALLASLLLVEALAGCGPQPAPTSAPAPTEPPVAAATTAPEASPATTGDCATGGGQLVVGLSWEPSKIDPHRTAAENGIVAVMQACETLVLRDATGDYLPGLAEAWEVSPDGAAYTMHLREGVKFQDGTPFNAEAVKYNLDRIVDPDTQSEEAISHLGPYTSTEVIDEYTAIVHLESAYAPFLTGLSTPWTCMVSPTAAEQWGPEEFQDHFVGTGPFVFKEWVRHDHILMEKNPDYWGGTDYFAHQGNACLDSVLFKFVDESSVRSGTLSTGEIQVAQEVPSIEVENLKSDPNVSVQVLSGAGTGVLLLFNMSKAPTDDLKVRQALNYGIDQAAIAEILYQGVTGPSYGPLTPSTPCYWSGAEQMYAYDPDKAMALLEEAGWTDTNGDGVREKDGAQLALDFPTHGEFPLYRDPAPIVKSQLAEIGVEVNVQNLAVPAWLEAGGTGNQHMGIIDWRDSDPDVDLRMLFLSSNSSAFAWNHHSNTELDDLILDGMVTLDAAKRCEIYTQIQETIMNDAMIKPVNIYTAIWGVRKEVQNLKFDPFGPSFFWAYDVSMQ